MNGTFWKLLIGFILSLGLSSSFATLKANTSVQRGEQYFLNLCSGCHSIKYGAYPTVSMPKREARSWFGEVPPDLSLTAKYRGKTWIVNYLQSFYPDNKQAFGCNNELLPNSQMPNVLFPLQNRQDYSQIAGDIGNFLAYVADPSVDKRYKIGPYVIGFLILVFTLAWLIGRNKSRYSE